MKNLRFEKLQLMSQAESKARSFEFHPQLTVFQGENHVGKSSVIKTIYWTFGVAVKKTHPSWQAAHVKSLIHFSVDGESYKILRSRDTVAVFDNDDELLISTSSIMSELAPFMADLLDFRLILTNKEDVPQIPPPAYAFLPFYVDQDEGWANTLQSFDFLGQYHNYRQHVIEFHSGIRPNRYYELVAQKRVLASQREDLTKDRSVIKKALEKLNLEPIFDGLQLQSDHHDQSIEQLLARLKELRGIRQTRAVKLAEILDERLLLSEQIDIVRASAKELSKDAAFAAELETAEVLCPTCGTVHSNDFANRYGILEDREACFEFLESAQERFRSLAVRVKKAQAALETADQIIRELQETLDAKHGDVTLKQVIEAEGRRVASGLFDQQLSDLADQIVGIGDQISEIEAEIRGLDDPERRKAIQDFYAERILENLRDLRISNPSPELVQILGRVVETGSARPRAVLANVLAQLSTIHKFSTALFAPIIIDSPNQQDQDAPNAKKMIEVIVSTRPETAQTILGTVSLHGVDLGAAKIHRLTELRSVLRKDEYPTVAREFQPYLHHLR